MIIPLLKHEILNLLKSKRIYSTVIMFLLLYVSIFVVRTIDYQKQLNQYIDDVRLNEDGIQSATNFSYLNPRAIQQPIIFSIFNEGHKIARVLNIRYYEPITTPMSLNEEENMFFIENSQLDITFLVTFFLSLFILLISYDSINGEKRVGTLRIIMTYPLKRQYFILKKTLGVFIFVAFTFTLPYLLSLVSLMVIYANLLTVNLFLSAFFYWFLVMMFILFFSLLGIFISCCTTNPNRSLVYSLLIWIMFSIVLPISWDYILSPKLYNDKINQLWKIHQDKWRIYSSSMWSENPYWSGNYFQYSGEGFYNSIVFADVETHATRLQLQKFIYENTYPHTSDVEQSRDDFERLRINIENTRNWIFFYNPIVLFQNLSMKITGNSRDDYIKFMHSTRELRNEIVNLGITEGWLLDYRFNAIYEEEYQTIDFEDLIIEFDYDYDKLSDYIEDFTNNAKKYEIQLPVFRRYEQPVYTFGEIFNRIWVYLALFVSSILVLWVMTWAKFMKYDVR